MVALAAIVAGGTVGAAFGAFIVLNSLCNVMIGRAAAVRARASAHGG